MTAKIKTNKKAVPAVLTLTASEWAHKVAQRWQVADELVKSAASAVDTLNEVVFDFIKSDVDFGMLSKVKAPDSFATQLCVAFESLGYAESTAIQNVGLVSFAVKHKVQITVMRKASLVQQAATKGLPALEDPKKMVKVPLKGKKGSGKRKGERTTKNCAHGILTAIGQEGFCKVIMEIVDKLADVENPSDDRVLKMVLQALQQNDYIEKNDKAKLKYSAK